MKGRVHHICLGQSCEVDRIMLHHLVPAGKACLVQFIYLFSTARILGSVSAPKLAAIRHAGSILFAIRFHYVVDLFPGV